MIMSSQDQLNKYFSTRRSHDKFQDSEIDEIARLLGHSGHAAVTCPRTYIVLRTINQLGVLESLLREGFGDHWFPIESVRGLPSVLENKVANEILDSQSIIQTDALDFEHGKHLHLKTADNHLFVIGDRLGSGHYGQVNKIVSKISFKEYALKRIRRRAAFGNRSKEAIRDFLAEKNRMKRLNHRHIVSYIGSYTDSKHLGLVMSPVADCDLAVYMQTLCTEGNASKRLTLQSFFGCLANALFYLHSQSIKHKDMKPADVLVRSSTVFITDFGISHDFLDTTSGAAVHTPRYSAPEVAQGGPRNESADIWSLGCVFMEMAAAIHGRDLIWIRNYFSERYTRSELYQGNPEAVESLLHTWGESWSTSEKRVLSWIQSMLKPRRENRPTAFGLLELITSDQNALMFCGICCVSEEFSDSEFSLPEKEHTLQPDVDWKLITNGSKSSIDVDKKAKIPVPRSFGTLALLSFVVVLAAIVVATAVILLPVFGKTTPSSGSLISPISETKADSTIIKRY